MLHSMIKRFKQYANASFERYDSESCQICDKYELRIFTAQLFIKMMYQDGKVTINEKNTVKKAISDCFDLPLKEVDELFSISNELFDYQSTCTTLSQQINQHCSSEHKNKIIEYLWQIAYSDHNLDESEEDLLMGITECLDVPYEACHKAKLKAQNAFADRKWTS